MKNFSSIFAPGSMDFSRAHYCDLKRNATSISRYTYDYSGFGVTSPTVLNDSFMAVVHLRALPAHLRLRNGIPKRMPDVTPSALSVIDFREQWQSGLLDPFDTINLVAPWAVFDSLLTDSGNMRIDRFEIEDTLPVADPTMFGIACAIAPVLSSDRDTSRLFLDHILTSALLYLAVTYGRANLSQIPRTGTLTFVQQRRVTEFIDARLSENLGIEDLAQVCGISARHFQRAFQKTYGEPPHKWHMRKRVDRAKQLLSNQQLLLVDIASACGFADQSHFGRVFMYFCGCSPGAYRKAIL